MFADKLMELDWFQARKMVQEIHASRQRDSKKKVARDRHAKAPDEYISQVVDRNIKRLERALVKDLGITSRALKWAYHNSVVFGLPIK